MNGWRGRGIGEVSRTNHIHPGNAISYSTFARLRQFDVPKKPRPNLDEEMAVVAAAKRLVPLFDRILVQRAEVLSKTKGGIVIPEKAQSKVLKGTVVAVGPGSRNDKGHHVPVSVKIGDIVLLPEYGGTKVELEEHKEYHLFREADILAKLES